MPEGRILKKQISSEKLLILLRDGKQHSKFKRKLYIDLTNPYDGLPLTTVDDVLLELNNYLPVSLFYFNIKSPLLKLLNEGTLKLKNNYLIFKSVGFRSVSTSQYKQWRQKVFERDNFTCQICGKRGVQIIAHHIKPWSKFPNLRYKIDNGQTLCKQCHRQIHKKKEDIK